MIIGLKKLETEKKGIIIDEKNPLKWIGIALNIGLLLSAFAFVFSYFELKKFPDPKTISPLLMQNPVQNDSIAENPFSFQYRSKEYGVIPMADYELWGLVVSHNDINKWYNMYHDENSVNLKDLCVIWGGNISSGVYQKMKYKSGEWTCYASFKKVTREEALAFKGNELSNNHLFTDSEEIRDIIRDVRIGDQIHFKGMLSSYGEKGIPQQYYRSSSLTREDTGNHACETVFVKEFDIIKKGNVFLYGMKNLSFYVIFLIIFLKVILFFYDAFSTRRRV